MWTGRAFQKCQLMSTEKCQLSTEKCQFRRVWRVFQWVGPCKSRGIGKLHNCAGSWYLTYHPDYYPGISSNLLSRNVIQAAVIKY